MNNKFLLLFFIYLFIQSIQTQIQLISDHIKVQQAISVQFIDSTYQYSPPIQVSKRYLQTLQIVNKTGYYLKSIENNHFPGVILYHQLPPTFMIGQIFQIKGKLINPAANNGTYVSFSFIHNQNILLKYTYLALVSSGNQQFKINIDTRLIIQGNYYVALYSTLSGSYDPKIIYSLKKSGPQPSKIPPPPAPIPPSGCSFSVINNKFFINWDQDKKSPLQKIVFSQNNKKVQYLLSNFQNSFEVVNKDFGQFTNGSVTVQIFSVYSQSNGFYDRISSFSAPWVQSFNAGPHNFSLISPKLNLTKQIPWTVAIGSTITIQGTALVNINNQMKVMQSQYEIGTYNLSSINSFTIEAGVKFSKNLTLIKAGVYILQINDQTGNQLLNRPVYVGTCSPLTPDFVDLSPQNMDSLTIDAVIESQPKTLDLLRNQLLRLINQRRAQWGRCTLTLDKDLNKLAQAHSNDMVQNNYLSHINKEGLGAQQRASQLGLNYPVTQNIAINYDLVQAHHKLCRSPLRLENIVNLKFSRVGLGISPCARGFLYITQIFAEPLPQNNQTNSTFNITIHKDLALINTINNNSANNNTTSNNTSNNATSNNSTPIQQIQKIGLQVKNWILKNYPLVKQDQKLSQIVSNWLRVKSTDTIFDYTWNTAKYMSNQLAGSFVIGPSSNNFTSGFIVGLFLKQPGYQYKKFGVGVIQLQNGKIKVYALYAR